MQTAAAVVATSYGSRRALPRTRSDGLLCLSGSYSRLLQGQKLPTGLRVLSVRFARSRPESRPAAFGHFPPPGCFAPISAVRTSCLSAQDRTFSGLVTVPWKGRISRRHPRFGRPYTEVAYQPMLEVLSLMRRHEFKTFVVSGGGIEFMRPWVPRVYGIPTGAGDRLVEQDNVRDARRKPVLFRLAEVIQA
jgi:hypothetical protein